MSSYRHPEDASLGEFGQRHGTEWYSLLVHHTLIISTSCSTQYWLGRDGEVRLVTLRSTGIAVSIQALFTVFVTHHCLSAKNNSIGC